jgi:peptidoglycan-N-acetylglucosamine deacetylase
MTPRHVLLSVLAFCMWSTTAAGQTLSLTFDDGLDPARQQNARLWNDGIIAGLKDSGVTAMVFPSLSRIGGEAGMDLIRAWAQAGHPVGNHTSGHRSLSSPKLTLDEFIADVVEADAALRKISGFVPMLRFPFLKEGDSVEKRDGIRQWMKTNGYRPAQVSIDASDWYFDQLFVGFTNNGRSEKAVQVQQAYIAHLLDRAAYYDGLARNVLGRSPRHVLLLHVNAINAASVRTIVTEFRARGWRFESPVSAFNDPLYALQPNTVPAGESIVWALARERGIPGLRYPGEDSKYEEPGLRALGLLP